jgi:tetratricopeptide (TPR) repeat protein
LVACSTKNNTFLSRNSHALSTKYNILYNGQIGLDKGIKTIESSNQDDFWHRLPVESMLINEEVSGTEKPKNADFELAETKATKAIQKHSMNIDGLEKNYQIDESYLLLGKARYYDQRFVPALDAFNYILYKYPNGSNIYEAKVWREKTNMRLGNDALVVTNISRLLKQRELSNQIYADAHALLSEAFLNLEEKDSAVAKLKVAADFTKKNQERARYKFILGQLYEELGKTDSAGYSYDQVIKMNRKSDRKYVMQSHFRKAQLFNYQKDDTLAFVKKFKKLLDDRENRPFLDLLNHQMGVFYDKQNKQKQALSYYNTSLKKATADVYLVASNYRNIGNMYFKNTKYPIAAQYYDSTLVKMNPKTREFIRIQKVRKDLDDVIIYEAIANRNDSIINVVSMSDSGRITYFENYIEKLKAADAIKKLAEDKLMEKQANIDRNNMASNPNDALANQNGVGMPKRAPQGSPSMPEINPMENLFYFYNPTTVAFGKVEFKKTWGNRNPSGNWRISTTVNTNFGSSDTTAVASTNKGDKDVAEEQIVIEAYTTDFYIKQLPTNKTAIDSIGKERNTAYYQLGLIYKEKFKEYQLAANKLEKLLQNNPEEKLIVPTLYNLYKIYQIIDPNKAVALKDRISSQYPNSRYAVIINNKNLDDNDLADSPDNLYNKLYQLYSDEQFANVLEKIDPLINQLSGEEMVAKFELLKANTIGKQKGLAAYKNALQFVADTYSNTEEGKKALEILTDQIPLLEKMEFSTADSQNYRILYQVASRDDQVAVAIAEKLNKFLAAENLQKLTVTYENYTGNEVFIILQGIKSKQYATDIANTLQENKEFKIVQPAIVISSDNYKIIQIKKNLNDYSVLKK